MVERSSGPTLLLQEQPSGRVVNLRHFQRHQPHSSPSLSWNGRYVAALVQQLKDGVLRVGAYPAPGHCRRRPA